MKSWENVWITMLWMEEILHLGWLKAQHNNGMFTTNFQPVQDSATIHSIIVNNLSNHHNCSDLYNTELSLIIYLERFQISLGYFIWSLPPHISTTIMYIPKKPTCLDLNRFSPRFVFKVKAVPVAKAVAQPVQGPVVPGRLWTRAVCEREI